MKAVRIGDIIVATCYCHKSPITVTGQIVAGSPITSSDGLPQARVGDLVVSSCGHTGVIVSGSSINFIDEISAARFGDSVKSSCLDGIIISGSNVSDIE